MTQNPLTRVCSPGDRVLQKMMSQDGMARDLIDLGRMVNVWWVLMVQQWYNTGTRYNRYD